MRLALLIGLALLVGACASGPPTPGSAPASSVAEAPALTAHEARIALAGLTVEGRGSERAPYSREAFGPAWTDVDGNGCNQRDDVLLRDVVPGTVRTARQGGCDHDVLAGSWVDPYTGARLAFEDLKDPAQAMAIQIDHVVPLAEAWASGAASWSDARRLVFANDTTGLLAVDGATNALKGADDPAAWRPRARFQCDYATRWIATKSRWDLTVDPPEVAALREMLARC